jgi:histone acetyltransferase MYST2
MMAGARSPLGSPSTEQKRHAQMVRDAREKFNPKDVPEFGEVPEDREPILTQFTSQWDLKLFREAQALAAEDCENALRGLPETKQTKYIEMGRHEMEVWYQSPYPEEYTSQPKIYICEFCLKYMRSSCQLRRHAAKCVWNHPPGDEIYRKEPLSVFEICGKRYKQYCQSLCLLAKFFLDHKTLYFDVEPFLFYVMTTADSSGCHIVGYFSKEKNSLLNYNVSCILTLPPYQRQGYGRLLIDFSYLLSREEGKIGSPEKPLSDLGLITYRAYWKDVLLEYICNYPEKELSIKAFSEEMGINPGDIISTLQVLGMIKYWKGQHVILKKEDLIDEYLAKSRSRPKHRQIYPGGLKWKPYEPTAKERRQAAQIQKNQDDNRQQKKR